MITRAWIIDAGGVVQRLGFGAEMPPGPGWVEVKSGKVEQGWVSDGKGGWMPPGGTGPVVMEITRRQLLIELADAKLITQQEALAAASTGAVPLKVEKVILTLPAADQFAARVTWATMSVVLRTDPLVAALALSEKMDDAAVGALFARAAAR